MKIQATAALCALLLSVSGGSAIAQQSPSMGAAPMAGGMARERDGHFKEALEKLNLSEDQKEKMRQIRHDAGAARQAGHPEGMKEVLGKLKAVLTPDQLERLRAMMKQYRQK